MFIVASIAYPTLPNQIASHWNTVGEADGYMDKFIGTFLLPIIMTVLLGLYTIVPKVDPLKENIESFRAYYNGFWIFFFIFFAYIFGLTLAWNLGYSFNLITAMTPAFSLMLYTVGVLVENAKRNWFVGIRTPWTLSSDTVWQKTHQLGGKLFKVAALLPLIALFTKDESLIVGSLSASALIAGLIPIVYSYFVYRAEQKSKE